MCAGDRLLQNHTTQLRYEVSEIIEGINKSTQPVTTHRLFNDPPWAWKHLLIKQSASLWLKGGSLVSLINQRAKRCRNLNSGAMVLLDERIHSELEKRKSNRNLDRLNDHQAVPFKHFWRLQAWQQVKQIIYNEMNLVRNTRATRLALDDHVQRSKIKDDGGWIINVINNNFVWCTEIYSEYCQNSRRWAGFW